MELEFPPYFGTIGPAMEQEVNASKLLVQFLKPEVDQSSPSTSA
jgi:hypothetical protein